MTSVCNPELILRLVGPLRLLRRDGIVDVTPRVAKAQGLLALIGAAPTLRRSRAWLQDKLWSDRAAEQGAASLRQTLHRLRDAVGPDCGWLTTEPGWIGLDPARVRVVADPEARDWDASGTPPEFCEGLDIDDQEFADWIRDQRFAFEDRVGTAPPPPRPALIATQAPKVDLVTLVVARVDEEDRGVATLASILSSQVAMSVGRIGGARVVLEERLDKEPAGDVIRLEVQGCRLGKKAMIQARLVEEGVLVWTNSREFPLSISGGAAMEAFERFIAEVMAATVHHLGRGGFGEGSSQIRPGYRAIENLFEFDGDSLANCERAFSATTEGPAANFHLAWRAQVRVISVIERVESDPMRATLEAVDMIARSLTADPQSSIVNAIASEVALQLEDNPEKAAIFAKRAVERDPYSPYARTCLAQTLGWLGRQSEAHTESVKALRLTFGHPNQSWWLLGCCVTALRSGRYGEAAKYGQMAHERTPTLKPPLRFLAALRFHEGNEAACAEALRKLKALEPEFSLDMMRSSDYPAVSLLNTPLIEVTRSGLV